MRETGCGLKALKKNPKLWEDRVLGQNSFCGGLKMNVLCFSAAADFFVRSHGCLPQQPYDGVQDIEFFKNNIRGDS